MDIPTLHAVKALDGRIFAMLSVEEQAVLDFYRTQGRKFDVAVRILNEADPDELASAKSQQLADQVLKSANSRVKIEVGSNAEAQWSARSSTN